MKSRSRSSDEGPTKYPSLSDSVNTIGRAGARDARNAVIKNIALTRSVVSSDPCLEQKAGFENSKKNMSRHYFIKIVLRCVVAYFLLVPK